MTEPINSQPINGQSTNGHHGRVFGLCRASDIKQTESISVQRELIQAACKAMNLSEPIMLEEPPGTSGYKTKFAQRPMGQYCLRTLRRGDTLVALRIDRTGRNMMDCYRTIEIFFERGVRIIILKGWSGQVIDLRDATSRLLLAILAWVAEEEARKIAERTKEGLAHRRQNGLSVGVRCFTYIQAYNAAGNEIPPGEFSKLKGHFKRNLPDRQLLDQLMELLVLQRATRANGNVLFDYCRERKFVNRDGKEWWRGTVYLNSRGDSLYSAKISQALKKVRRLAVAGNLPEDYNERILAITRDNPMSVRVKKRRPRRKIVADGATATFNEADMISMENWTAEQLLAWIRQSQAEAQAMADA